MSLSRTTVDPLPAALGPSTNATLPQRSRGRRGKGSGGGLVPVVAALGAQGFLGPAGEAAEAAGRVGVAGALALDRLARVRIILWPLLLGAGLGDALGLGALGLAGGVYGGRVQS